MDDSLASYCAKLESLAREEGLDYYPVSFETVPDSFMTEVAVYGLPVRMPHWSFGVRYIYQFVQHRMGHSRLFEVVFPGNPNRAYLAQRNSLEENTLVMAHVLGHADFAKNNLLFKRTQEEVGYHIVEQAAAHARQITEAIEVYGEARVEAVLDAALALEQYVNVHLGLRRPRYPEYLPEKAPPVSGEFMSRFDKLAGGRERPTPPKERKRAPVPPAPERDLLWFIAHYAPELEGWERDIFLVVREESFYFYPVFACQIMNEGWASFWHAQLLRKADFLPQQVYLDAIKAHSDVVRPYAGGREIALTINPYHLGFKMWESIVAERGAPFARQVMQEDDDFSFVRNYLTEDLAEELRLFEYVAAPGGDIRVEQGDIETLREKLLAPKFNFGAPSVAVTHVHLDGTLELTHDHQLDGRGLDLERARKVIQYVHRVWRRPVVLRTVDERGRPKELASG
ncbi:SpoVR family protein [Pelomicrobium sp. G1]|uniref:SpoVR family protein n=1 Tax=unclassified Pelomicrobium TaxID=2815318 RepID=UPI0021DF1980|nr:MAG: stage V sporulation protein R [Burkholderiales bacterium]